LQVDYDYNIAKLKYEDEMNGENHDIPEMFSKNGDIIQNTSNSAV